MPAFTDRRTVRSAAAALFVAAVVGGCTPSAESDAPAGGAAATQAAATPSVAEEVAPQFPTAESTGPRVPDSMLQASDAIVTSQDGQVLERLHVKTRVKVVHDDVVVRDVRVVFDATAGGVYALHVDKKADGTCPSGTVFEHVEVVGDTAVLSDGAKAVYGACPYTLRNSRIHKVGTGVRIVYGTHIEGNYIHASHTLPDTEAHRSGLGLNGGSGHVIRGNTIECEGSGCSGALVMYGDFAPVEDVLIEGNLLNTTGRYCTHGGSLSTKKYPDASDVRFVGNHFGRRLMPACGRSGPVANFGDQPTNVWEDNVWHDTGEPL